jgi:hypothetical protein
MRDIIYFDRERAQSFYAQLAHGLPTTHTRNTQQRKIGSFLGELAIPFLSKGQGSIAYERSSGDATTYQTHDEVLQLLLDALKQRGKLLQFTADQYSWEPDVLTDGTFLQATGAITLIDMKYVMDAFDLLTITSKAVPNQNRKEKENQTNMLEFIKTFTSKYLGDGVQLTLTVDPTHHDRVFVLNTTRQMFRYPVESLLHAYGSTIRAGWYVLCILHVNKDVQDELETPKHILSTLERLQLQLIQINPYFQRTKFPAIAATPIAIYREV